MASEHSITIQVAPFSLKPFSPGHVAVVINTPTEQTYAGFGPNRADQIANGLYSELGQFNVQKMPRDVSPHVGTAGEKDYSTAFDHNEHSTFTIPISKEQAEAALAETARLRASHGSYNIFSENVCSTIVNQIVRAAGLPGLSTIPGGTLNMLENIDEYNSRYQPTVKRLNPPNAWRDLQKDYAYTGRGLLQNFAEVSGREVAPK